MIKDVITNAIALIMEDFNTSLLSMDRLDGKLNSRTNLYNEWNGLDIHRTFHSTVTFLSSRNGTFVGETTH